METLDKDTLMDKYRYVLTEYEWYDCEFDEWKNKLRTLGVDVGEIYFSGFSSQGDGAMFTGRINVPQFMVQHKLDTRYPLTYKMAHEHGGVHASLYHRGNYYHENSAHLDCTYETFQGLLDCDAFEDDDLRVAAVEAMDEALNNEYLDFEADVLEICRGYMQEIYQDLEAEYDYLTSDAAVLEFIEANNLTD